MNYKDPKDRNFINKIVQEYIDIQDQKGKQFSTLYTKERLIKQFKDLKDQLVKEVKRTAHQFKEETKKELTISNTFETEELLEGTYNNNKEYELAKIKEKQFRDTHEEERTQEPQLSETEKAYLNRTLLALEGARNIQENDQATQIIFLNTGLTQASNPRLSVTTPYSANIRNLNY
ncbi:hypothetical protein C2G38_2233271 [Gigaspora rosea]|uniref:Uncharacterized protein n=1 Tax=Gigaspora rosea TaxID=44941 RepID=A0A397TRF1_9GLOM|nr:hypothetical protein C2G38_2233271 [Gigaspora rosea]